MPHWTEEFHAILLQINGAMNRPDVDARFLAHAGIKLDRALYPLLSRIGVLGPIGTVELAAQVGRDHSTVSRQVAKLEQLGLVEREPLTSDRRIRMLRPSRKGRRLVEKFAATRRKLIEAHFQSWSERDRQLLVKLLKKAVAQPAEADAAAKKATRA